MGPYTISGRVLILPITGSGQSNITLGNCLEIYLYQMCLRDIIFYHFLHYCSWPWADDQIHRKNENQKGQSLYVHRRFEANFYYIKVTINILLQWKSSKWTTKMKNAENAQKI